MKTVSLKILKCRFRFKKRRSFRRILESTIINGSDDRPFASVKVNGNTLIGLLDSGANVSVLGRDCLAFLDQNDISYHPLRSSVKTANGIKQNVIGFCILPINFKNVTKNITFYLVPSLIQNAYFGTNFWREFAIAPDLIPSSLGNLSEVLLDLNLESNFHKLTPEEKLILEKTILEFPSYEKYGLGCTDVLEPYRYG